MEKRILVASWLFLIGSILLVVDAISDIANHLTFMSIVHLSEGILFLVGSIFFMPESRPSEAEKETCLPKRH